MFCWDGEGQSRDPTILSVIPYFFISGDEGKRLGSSILSYDSCAQKWLGEHFRLLFWAFDQMKDDGSCEGVVMSES